MSTAFEDLGWPESTLYDLAFQDGSLTFKMLDLLSYGDLSKFELVKVAVSDIEALHIELRPFENGKYLPGFTALAIGTVSEQDPVFEGITHENPFTDSEAEYFWLSGSLKSKAIEIERTGEFRYVEQNT